MQGRKILLHFFAVPLRQRLVAGGIAIALGSGMFLWPRYGATPPATMAELSFDAGAAQQADPEVLNTHPQEPAVVLAQLILNDDTVVGLARQTGISPESDKIEAEEFRSRLDMEQTSAQSLSVKYNASDTRLSAVVANAVANTLVAWMPKSVAPNAASIAPTATPAPSQDAPPTKKVKSAKSGRQSSYFHSQSRELDELEKRLKADDRRLDAASHRQANASQKAEVAAPPPSKSSGERRMLESQLSVAQKKLEDLRARYTDAYPDVERTEDDINGLRGKLASLPPVSNEGERAAILPPPKQEPDTNEADQLRLERARLTQIIQIEKRREASLRQQAPSRVENSAPAIQIVSPVHASPDPVAGQIFKRPFTLVRLAGGTGVSQSKSALMWWPLAGILLGLLYWTVAMWGYRPLETAALAVLSVEPVLLKHDPASQEQANFETALTDFARQVSGRPNVASQALWALRTFLDVPEPVKADPGDSATSASGNGNGSERSSQPATMEKAVAAIPPEVVTSRASARLKRTS
jgi:hypothetical protein